MCSSSLFPWSCLFLVNETIHPAPDHMQIQVQAFTLRKGNSSGKGIVLSDELQQPQDFIRSTHTLAFHSLWDSYGERHLLSLDWSKQMKLLTTSHWINFFSLFLQAFYLLPTHILQARLLSTCKACCFTSLSLSQANISFLLTFLLYCWKSASSTERQHVFLPVQKLSLQNQEALLKGTLLLSDQRTPGKCLAADEWALIWSQWYLDQSLEMNYLFTKVWGKK